jgi:hypothetical protein
MKRKDSILANFYYQKVPKLPKFQGDKGGSQVGGTGSNYPYHAITNPTGYRPKIGQILGAAQKREQEASSKQPTIKQGYKELPYQKRIREQKAREQAQQNSALAQTMALFTPSGSNTAAGAIGASDFVNMNPLVTGPVMSTSRLYGAGRSMFDPNTQNPYFGSNKSVGENILGGLGLAGDIGMLRMGVRKPSGSLNPEANPNTRIEYGDFKDRNARVMEAWFNNKKQKSGIPPTADDYRKLLQQQRLQQQTGDILRKEGVPDPRQGGAYKPPTDKLTWKDPKTGEIRYQLEAEDYGDFKTPELYKEAQQDFRNYKRSYLQDIINKRNANLKTASLIGEYGKMQPINPKLLSLDPETSRRLANLGQDRFTDFQMFQKDFLGNPHNLSFIEPNELTPITKQFLRNPKSDYFMLTPNKYGGLVKYQSKGEVKKKKPITHYVFAEGIDEGPFSKEAQNLKTFISKNYPGEQVEIIPGYGQEYFNTKVLPTLQNNVTGQDRVYLFGHHGSRYAGINNSEWGNAFEKAQKRAGNFNCYLGSCASGDLAGEEGGMSFNEPSFSNINNFYYRPSSSWLGVNPNVTGVQKNNSHEGVLNAMYTRSDYNPNRGKLLHDLREFETRAIFQNPDYVKSLKDVDSFAEKIANISQDSPEYIKAQEQLNLLQKRNMEVYDDLATKLRNNEEYLQLESAAQRSNKPYVTKKLRPKIDYSESNTAQPFNKYIHIDKRKEYLKNPMSIENQEASPNFLANPFSPIREYGGLVKAQKGIFIPNVYPNQYVQRFGPGGESTDGCPPGYNKNPLTGDCIPNGWVAPSAAPQSGPTKQARTQADLNYISNVAKNNKVQPNQGQQATVGVSRSNEAWRQNQVAEIRRQEAMRNSELARSMAGLTPSGNLDAGVIGASTFADMNPLTGPVSSIGRLTQAAIGKNPYGFNMNDGLSFRNGLATLGLAGDLAFGYSGLKSGVSGINNKSGFLSNAETSAPKQSGFFGNMKEMVTNPKQYFTKPGTPIITEGKTSFQFKPTPPQNFTDPRFRNMKSMFDFGEGEYDIWRAHTDARLKNLAQRGQMYDRAGLSESNWLNPETVHYHGTHDGRPIVEVKMPNGNSEYFYKSSGWANKSGAGAKGTTEGMWQTYDQHGLNFDPDNNYKAIHGWFGKNSGYKDWYGSNTFRNFAGQMDKTIAEKFGVPANQVDDAIQFFPQRKTNAVNTLRPQYSSNSSVENIVPSTKGDWVTQQIVTPGARVMDWNKVGQTAAGVGVGSGLLSAVGKNWLKEPKKRNGGVIDDDMGQWAHPGKVTRIKSPYITMQGVPYPVLGVSDTGDTQMMYPGEDYEYNGSSVTEFPIPTAQDGRTVYTNDPIKVENYTDSLNAYNAGEDMYKFGKGIYDLVRSPINKEFRKNYNIKKGTSNPTPWPGKNINIYPTETYVEHHNRKPGSFYERNIYDSRPDYYLGENGEHWIPNGTYWSRFKKPVQPYILQQQKPGSWKPLKTFTGTIEPKPEPRLKGKPQRVSSLPMGAQTDEPSVQFKQMPQIGERPIQMGEYKVSYYDPEIKDWNERSFMTEDESGKFMNEMSQRGFGSGYGNVTQRRVINKKAYGGSMMQNGGPTAQDSIIVRNSAIANKIYYDNLRKKGMYGAPKIENWKYGNPRDNPEFLREKQSGYLKDWMENVKQRGLESQRNILTGRGSMTDRIASASAEAAWLQNNPGKTRNDYIKLVSKTLGRIKASGLSQFDSNKYYYKDLAPEVIDPSAPFVTIDTRIQPQYQTTYTAGSGKNPSSGGWVELLEYDPLAVTPYNMRTPQEKIEWEKKYGSKKITKSTPVEKKQSKPKIEPKPEPTLKPRPFVPATKIPMGQPSTGMRIRERDIPNIQSPSKVDMGKYKVDYFDPTEGTDVQGGWQTRSFRSDKEASDFMKQRNKDNNFYGPSMTQRVEYALGGPTFYNQDGFATTLQTTTDPSVEKARDCGKDCGGKAKGIIDYSTSAERRQDKAWDKQQAAADEKAAKERKIASDNYINMKYGFDGYPLDGSDYDNRQQQYNEFLKVNPTFGKDPSYTGKLKPKERYALLDNMLLQVKRAPGISYSTRLSKKFNIADPKKLTVADMMNYANQMGGYDKFREWVDAGGPEIQRYGGGLTKYQTTGEVTYTHEPGKRGAYRLQRTVTPYTRNRDIKRFTQAPTDPRQVNFLQNYAGAITGYQDDPGFKYPTQVPYEGAKHWNIDRFVIDPQFTTSTGNLQTGKSTLEQNRANTLADMYKYYMLQDPEHKGRAFRKAKRFVRREIDPRIKGSFLQSYNTASTSNPDYFQKGYQGTANYTNQNSLKDLYFREATGEGKVTPEEIEKLKDVSMDYFRNYKKMSRRDAKDQWNTWEQQANAARETGTYSLGGLTKAQGGYEKQKDYPIDLRLSQFRKPGSFFTGYGFSQRPVPNVDVHGVGVIGEGNINNRLRLSGNVNSPSVFYPGGNKMFMNPNFEMGMKYRFDDGGDPSIPNLQSPVSMYKKGGSSKPSKKAYGGPMVDYMKGKMNGPNMFKKGGSFKTPLMKHYYNQINK